MPPIEDIDELNEGVVDDSIPGDPLDKGAGKQPSRAEKSAPPPKMSVREAINSALDEADGKADQANKTQDKKVEPAKPNTKVEGKPEEKTLKKVQPTVKKVSEQISDALGTDGQEVEADEGKDLKPDNSSAAYAAPKGWTKEAKAEFDNLPEVVKASIAKREEEASKGFKDYGEKTKTLTQYDNVIKQYAPDHQQYGLTAPQFVERTLQWFKALDNPNKDQAFYSLKELINAFGLEQHIVKSYAPKTSTTPQGYQEPSQSQGLPPEVNQKISDLETRLSSYQQGQEQQILNAEKQRIEKWSADKPHFEKVRISMRRLVESGEVPLENGVIPLDKAYEAACRKDPEIFQEILEAEVAKKEVELLEKEKTRKAKLQEAAQNARRANVSLRPNSPTAPIQNGAPTNQKKLTVRDSIMLGIKEARGT